ncbi:MAG: polyphosphate kinase 2 family protein [Chthonomonas sp.]|nr:polyphosphate kinase 2 family protein [Chthonomonas sp.]
MPRFGGQNEIMPHAVVIKPDQSIDLAKFDTCEKGGLDKETAQAKVAELGKRLTELQELMYAAGRNSLLVLFQGRDTAGKDGAINRMLDFVNVQSARVAAFKVPTPVELAHDFLWRVHQETPGKGGITVFNRSHYEDVLVVRVHELAPKEVWSKRYEHINNFERILTDSGTILIKFCLWISKDEQEQRLLDREQDPTKSWKLSVGDWKEREKWDDYTAAYEDVLKRCSPENAPWRLIAADHKWYRDLAVMETLISALEPYEAGWRKHLEEIGVKARAELEAFRAAVP